MSRKQRSIRLRAACAASFLLMLAPTARASESEAAAPYRVPRECPARAVWVSLVRARLAPLQRTHPLLNSLSVQVEKTGAAVDEAYVGELVSTADPALNGSRSVSGASCEEVLDALSFIGALGLERVANDAGNAPAAPPENPAARVSEAPSSTSGIDRGAASSSPVGTERIQAVAFALLQPGLTPAHSLGFGVAIRFEWSAPGWQPSLLLGAYSSLPDERAVPGGRLRFEHWSSHAVACPWRFPARGHFGLRPCVELDVGRSSGEGLGFEGAARRSAPWLTGGVQLRAEVALGERVALGASVAGVSPFWRAHFFIRPDVKGFDTPDFGFRAGSYANLFF